MLRKDKRVGQDGPLDRGSGDCPGQRSRPPRVKFTHMSFAKQQHSGVISFISLAPGKIECESHFTRSQLFTQNRMIQRMPDFGNAIKLEIPIMSDYVPSSEDG